MEKSSIKFPTYNPNEINTVVVEVTDHTTYDELQDRQLPTVSKNQTGADEFMQELNSLCAKFG